MVGIGGVGMGKRERQRLQRGTRKHFGVMDKFIILIVMMISWVYTWYVKTHQVVYFKYVQFIIHQLYLNKVVISKCQRASLVAQWLRVCLPMRGTRVRALVWEDPTCRGATRPVSHNYWACASGACAPQRERPWQWEAHAPQWRVAPARHSWRKPSHRNEDPTQPKNK